MRVAVLAILAASAGAVTKLMAINMQAARAMAWDAAAMDSRVAIAAAAYPLTGAQAAAAPQLAADALGRVAAAAGADAAAALGPGSAGYAALAYCSTQLLSTCSAGLST